MRWRSFDRWRRGIGPRLLVRVLLFSSAITLLLTSFQLYFEYRYAVRAIESRMSEIEGSYLQSLGGSLWNLDSRQIELQIEGILRLPAMRFVEVRETTDRANPLVVSVGHRQEHPALRRVFPLVHTSRGEREQLGVLSIEATFDEVNRAHLQRAIIVLIREGTEIFLVSFFILSLTHRLVTRHLTALAGFLGTYDVRQPPPPLRLQRRAPRDKDELDHVLAAFERMRQSLERAYEGLARGYEALRRSELYLVEGQRLAHMGSWAFNAAGFDYWSSELFRIYGLDPGGKAPTVEEYLGLVHPEDREFVAETIQKMFAEGRGFDFTKRIVRPDGEIRRVRCVGVPATHGGTLQGFVGTGIDVTEQERILDELKRSEFYLSEGQRLGHAGSWSINPSGFFDYWSRELFQIYGLDPEKKAPTIEEYLASVHPQDREFMARMIERMLAEGLGCDVKKRIVRPDGKVRYVRCVGIPIVENGFLKRIVGTAMDITEQEELTQELGRREAYLAEAQRLSHTGSFGWKPDTGEIIWSAETYRIFEYDQAVTPTIDLVAQRAHPEDRADVQSVIERASQGASDFEHAYRLLLPDGRVKHVHALAHATQDAAGNREFVGAVTDITDQRRAEESLRESESYLAEAQKLSHTGSWAWSPDTDARYWSEECYRVLGFDPRAGVPRTEEFIQRIHPDDQPGFRELFQTAIREKAQWKADYRIVHPDGRIRYIHVVGHAVLDRSGDLHEFVGTVMDITECKRAEQELQQLVDLVPQLIAVMGPDGKFIHVNRVTREYTGLTLEEFREEFRSGDVIGRLFHPDDLEKLRAQRKVGFSRTEPFEYEARLLGKDGVHRWFLIRYNPLVEDGRVRKWYGTATEIEWRKQEEEQIRQENVRLEERTRIAQELHDTLLQSCCAATMKLGAATDGLPSDSPLKTKIDSILELFEQGIAEGRNAIQGLRSSNYGPLDLVGALSGIQRELATPADVDFRVSVVGLQKPLRGPIRQEFYRIGREALVNAFSHSRAKRVELELEYSESNLSLRVRDNGCGIDPPVLDKGFEGHWGLAGMRERAARLGGLLRISSSATGGTEIQLSIPGDVAFQL